MSELCSFPDFRRIMEDINRKEKLFLNYVPVYIVLPLVSKTKTKTLILQKKFSFYFFLCVFFPTLY